MRDLPGEQMSLSFGLAVVSLITAFFLAELPRSDHVAVARALRHGYFTMAAPPLPSSTAFWWLRQDDGESVGKGTPASHAGEPRQPELS